MKTQILKKLAGACVLVASLMGFTSSAHAGLMLSFSEDDLNLGFEQTFSVDLVASPDAPIDALLGFGLDISFDNSVLQLNGFTLNTALFGAAPSMDGDMIAGAALGGPLFATEIVLGTFEFTTIGTGVTALATSVTDGDLFEGVFTTNIFNPEISQALTDVSVVSEPAGIAVFGLVVMSLMRLRRQK